MLNKIIQLIFLSIIITITSCNTIEVKDKTDNIVKEQERIIIYSPTYPTINQPIYPPNYQKYKSNDNKKTFLKKRNEQIAILIPLTGKYKDIGKSLLNVAYMSIINNNIQDIDYQIFDTKGTESGTKKAIQKIKKNPNIKMIIGPLFSKNTKIAIKETKNTGLSIISLSNDYNLAHKGAYILGSSPFSKVREIMKYIIYNKFEVINAVLPNNDLGATISKSLRSYGKDKVAVNKIEFFLERNKNNIKYASLRALNSLKKYDLIQQKINNKENIDNNIDNNIDTNIDDNKNTKKILLIFNDSNNIDTILSQLKNKDLEKHNIYPLLLNNININEIQGRFDKMLINEIIGEKSESIKQNFKEMFGYDVESITTVMYDAIALSLFCKIYNNYNEKILMHPIGFVGMSGKFKFLKSKLSERKLKIYSLEELEKEYRTEYD